MKAINKEDWIPSAGLSLEPNALNVVKSVCNSLVVAGPGAGKTELLAQRAAYLLLTNSCKFPHKILAISFKKDAAFNLKERVKSRCGDELSRRFDSLTFDSFAKQIVDRFKAALPIEFQINGEYDIINEQVVLDSYNAENITYVNTTSRIDLLNFHNALSYPNIVVTDQEKIRCNVWNNLLNQRIPLLTFAMIMRLAVIIIRANPKIKKFLQQTYNFIFLDEFQDTTTLQYEFFKACFLRSTSIFTAVGDDKQRIMLWAGAKKAIFEDFLKDTKACKVPLIMNFRSAPRLVELQNHLIQHLLSKTDFATAASKWEKEQGECRVWFFDNPETETNYVFQNVQRWITDEGINPRDICILVKQQLNIYVGSLIEYFNKNGIKARDENIFQFLLTEELSSFIINILYVSFHKKMRDAKNLALAFLGNIHTGLEDSQLLKLEIKLAAFSKNLKIKYKNKPLNDLQINQLISEIIDYADERRIKATYPAYKNQTFFNSVINELKTELLKCFKNGLNISGALDSLLGEDTIPIMTVHKSKGLEYHSIIFIGLEDGAFWSFQTQPDEDKCTFFVALSRAKERVVFTFCSRRPDRNGRTRNQSFQNIDIIFKELQASGIVEQETITS